MSRIIDFSNLKQEKRNRTQESFADSEPRSIVSDPEDEKKKFVSILLEQNPGKLIYSLKEAAQVLGIGQEFIRRRVKRGKIKAVSLGDKQAINVIELARILSEGV